MVHLSKFAEFHEEISWHVLVHAQIASPAKSHAGFVHGQEAPPPNLIMFLIRFADILENLLRLQLQAHILVDKSVNIPSFQNRTSTFLKKAFCRI